jgi:hypothetical protein
MSMFKGEGKLVWDEPTDENCHLEVSSAMRVINALFPISKSWRHSLPKPARYFARWSLRLELRRPAADLFVRRDYLVGQDETADQFHKSISVLG